jgi:hypothetical protein
VYARPLIGGLATRRLISAQKIVKPTPTARASHGQAVTRRGSVSV